MQESVGKLFEQEAQLICIPTNGSLTKAGEAIMGRGYALEAKLRWPALPSLLGKSIQLKGNCVHLLLDVSNLGYTLGSFPVRHKWWEQEDIRLIEKSAQELKDIVDLNAIEKVVLPRPWGDRNKSLDWSKVKLMLEKYFDDRFIVIPNI